MSGRGLIGSLAVHGALLAAMMVAWPMQVDTTGEGANFVPVDLVAEISDETNIRAAAPELGDALNPEIEGSPQETTPPVPDDVEAIAPDKIKEKEKKKDDQKKPTPRRTEVDDFFNKNRKTDGTGSTTTGAREVDPNARFGVGDATGLTATEVDAIASKMEGCWRSTADLSDADRLLVRLRLVIGPDGDLMREPQMLRPSAKTGNDASLQVAVDRALRAVNICKPFPVASGRTRGAQFTFTFFAKSRS
jgi:hypothetical protein